MFKLDSRTKFARSKLVHRDDAQDFLQRCLPGQRSAQAGFPQPLHALLDGDLLERTGGQLLHDGIAQDFVHHEHFGDGVSAGKAGETAFLAADPLAERGVFQVLPRDSPQHRWLRLVRFGAKRAVFPDQAKADDAADARSEQERFDFHVDQPGEDSGGAPAVNRADDEVAGQSGLHGDGGGLGIANLTYHDDLRVLTHERA